MGKIQEFEDKVIRSLWDNEKEEWYFSIVDVVDVLIESSNPRRYWSDLKRKMKDEEGAGQLYDKIVQLKMESSDGKNTVPMLPTCREFSASSSPFPK